MSSITEAIAPWLTDPQVDAVLLRYALVLMALVAGAAWIRGRVALAQLTALTWAVVAVGFWVFGLARPYGLFEDPAATSWAAALAMRETAGEGVGFLAVEPGSAGVWGWLLRAGCSAGSAMWLPSLLPLVVLPSLGVLAWALWRAREDAALGGFLWACFSTSELESLRGMGLVPGIWQRPEAAVLLLVSLGLVLGAGRVLPERGRSLAAPLLALGTAAWLGRAARPEAPPLSTEGPLDAVLLMTLDQSGWLALGLWGLWHGRDVAARSLVAGGGLAIVVASLGGPAEPWLGQAWLRLGLLLGSALALAELASRLGEHVGDRVPGLTRTPARSAVAAAIGVCLVPGTFLTWWDPVRSDPLARASLEPVSPAIATAMKWVREQTPPSAVFVASADYAPYVAVLGGRRVLRAPSLRVPSDDERRTRAEGAALAGRASHPLLQAYGVRFVFVAPGDFRARGIRGPGDLESRPGLKLRYADANDFRVYELETASGG